MQQKENSSVGSGAQARDRKGLSYEDTYLALRFGNQKLRRTLRKIEEAYHDWKERALQYQAKRDDLREQLQEQGQERRRKYDL